MEKINQDLLNLVKNLPAKPGVYQFFDISGNLLYIGKAKNLKKRVVSYFSKIHFENNKIRTFVKKVANIQHIVVESETDALLLENNLIKKFQPKYNIDLKDDKTFPWICVKNERFPRVFSTRTIVNDGSKYFGPYTSAYTVKILLDLIRQLYKLRTCTLNLTEENVNKNRFKVCLEYHIGNCKGPCEGLQTEEDYNLSIEQIYQILKGNLNEVISYLKEMMYNLAKEHKFENAENVRQKLEILEKFQTKSTIVNPSIRNVDVFTIIDENKYAYVNFIKVVNGSIIQAHTVEIQRKLDETKEEMLVFAIMEIRERLNSNSREIILPFKPGTMIPCVNISVPQRGDKKKLLELSARNAKYFMLERSRQRNITSPEKSTSRILNTLKNDLRMPEVPFYIECFDNSNIQGTNPVAACVVFKNGKPSKKEYRHYNIKTVSGPDDYASMEEIIFRRYTRLIAEDQNLPQLIVIDGGKGQLHAAINSLEKLKLRGKIAIIGIAKRLEEIYFYDDPVPLYINKNSESLKLLQNIRNEAHRFGINFHRLKRSGSMIKSGITSLAGLGEKSTQKLWAKFNTLDEMKNAPIQELENIIGKAKAKILVSYFKNLTTKAREG